MSVIMQALPILGVVIVLISVLLLYHTPKDDEECHIRVGKEWMTVAEYRKRYCPLPEPNTLDEKLEIFQKIS